MLVVLFSLISEYSVFVSVKRYMILTCTTTSLAYDGTP